VKHLGLYRFIAVLGIAAIALVLASAYLNSIEAISILEPLYLSQIGFGLWLLVLISGIVFLTVGLVGIGRQYSMNHRNLLTLLVVLLVPLLTFATVFTASMLMYPLTFTSRLRDEITQVKVINNNPLVLILGVKAITIVDSRIDSVFILNSNRTMVAEYRMDDVVVLDEHGYPYSGSVPICVLSGGSSMTLTVRFNCTLSPGDYTIFLASGGFGLDSHGSAPFTIP